MRLHQGAKVRAQAGATQEGAEATQEGAEGGGARLGRVGSGNLVELYQK